MTPTTARPTTEILAPRDVPLGGLRAMNVRRTLPQRQRSLIGAWCFLDHYGPDDNQGDRRHVGAAPPAHRSADRDVALRGPWPPHRQPRARGQLIRPGQLNVMTAGHGICHAEVSPEEAPTRLHGVQLWVCLPAERRVDTGAGVAPDATIPPAVRRPGRGTRQVLLGARFDGARSPAATHSARCAGADLVHRARRRTPRSPPPRTRRSSTARSRSASAPLHRGRRPTVSRRPAGVSGDHPPRAARPVQCGGPRPAAAARRPAVRRGDRDVVELRRPRATPRSWRRAPTGWPRSPTTTASSRTARRSTTVGSASSRATTSRRSRPGPSPTPASSPAADRRVGANRRPNDAESAQRGVEITPERHHDSASAGLNRIGGMPGPVVGEDGVARCPWGVGDPVMRAYHDTEWGLPVSRRGVRTVRAAQRWRRSSPGSPWSTILRKRPAFRAAFAGFDADAIVATFGERRRRAAAWRRRHRAQPRARSTAVDQQRRARTGARRARTTAALATLHLVVSSPTPRSAALDSARSGAAQWPPRNRAALAKELKNGAASRFVGPTTMYALMEAIGIVDDHLEGCHRHGIGIRRLTYQAENGCLL